MNILGQHVNPQEFTWVYYPLIRKSPRLSQMMKQCLTNSSLNRYLRKLEGQSFNWFLGKIRGKLYNHCLPSPKVVGTFSPQLSQVQQQCLTFDIGLCQHYYTSLELDNFWMLSLWILQVRWNILVFYSAFFVFPALECIYELVEIWEHKCADDFVSWLIPVFGIDILNWWLEKIKAFTSAGWLSWPRIPEHILLLRFSM